MVSIPKVKNWKWYHSLYAVGAPTLVGTFFMDTTPIFNHEFWIPFWASLILFGIFGQLSSGRRKKKGHWETFIRFNAAGIISGALGLALFCVAIFNTSLL